MTNEQIADILYMLDYYASVNEASPLTCTDAAEAIRTLQARLAAEQQTHEATIKHCDEMLDWDA